MNDWILYDEFVDLVQQHHFTGYSGLITGLSDLRHSFQVGFGHGEIILLSYRIKKGLAALPFITQIERAKITDHPTSDIGDTTSEIIDTPTVLTILSAHTLDETASQTTATDITVVTNNIGITEPKAQQALQKPQRIDRSLKLVIEAAAVEHLGPIGAMICEDHLQDPQGDLKATLTQIVTELEASETDTQAFFSAVYNP